LAFELSLQRGQSSTDFISNDQKESRVSVLLRRSSSREIRSLERQVYDWHEKNNSEFGLLVTGENIPVAHVSELNIRSLIGGLGASILIVTLLIGYLVKRLRIGIVALASTLLPAIFGFGMWGLLGNDVGLASALIIALTFGVVIDDAVHMLYRFVDGRDRLALGNWEAAAYSIHRAGTAITTTSIVMVGGLSVLLLSSFKVNSSFGATTCLIISIALTFDLLILPRLLIWADPENGSSKE
jgi:predicted RND superfamily exporter protein